MIDMVNYWKAIFLEKHKLRAGDKIGLGYILIDIYYFGALIAAAEIGLQLVVLDNSYNQAKIERFYPLDLFLRQEDLKYSGVKYIEENSLAIEYESIFDNYQIQHPERFSEYVSRTCAPTDVLMLCTSSGTTGTPKSVNHTHAFIHELSKRNASLLKFKGQVCHVKNLHHGSSLTTYFLPSLYSDECEGHHVFSIKTDNDIRDCIGYFVSAGINHVQLSYAKEVELFLQESVTQNAKFDDLTIHTLGYIDPDWQQYLRQIGNVKIISIFGSNETSGPIMTNELTAHTEDFDSRKFFICDDFYNISQTENNQLSVSLPVYPDRTITMQDDFSIDGNVYYHRGRNDMFRIGETIIDASRFLTLTSKLKIDGDLVFDQTKQKIYYADWGTGDVEHNLQLLNSELQEAFGVEISQWKILDYKSYLYGIKIDHDLIRETFRQ